MIVENQSLRHRLDTLLIYDPDRSSSTVNVWVARPTPVEEQTFGTLFVMAALDGSPRVNHEIISLLQEELKNRYYQSTDLKPELAFEQALQQTNQRLHQLITDGVSQWVDRANIVVGIIRHRQLFLTSVGVMHAYMLRQERMNEILEIPRQPAPRNPLRLFDHVVSGQLANGDKLLFCTASLFDYFSVEKLRRTLLDHTPSDAVRQLETTLLGVQREVAFGALVVALQNAEQPAAITAPASRPSSIRNSPQVSMNDLISRERQTEKFLSPSIWPAIKDFLQRLQIIIQQFIRTTIFRQPQRRILPGGLQPASSTGRPVRATESRLSGIIDGLKNFLVMVKRSFRISKPNVKIPSVSMPSIPSPRSPRQILHRLIWRTQRMNRQQQLALGALVIIIALLTTSVIRSGTLMPVAKGSQIETTVTDTRDALSKAEAALLYGGEDVAREQLQKAEALFATLPNKSKKDRDRRAPLEQRITRVTEQISHLTIVTNPTTVANFAIDTPQLHPTQLYLVGETMAVADPQAGIVVAVGRKEGSEPEAIANTLDTGKITTGATSGRSTITFATDRKSFVEVDVVKNTWKPLDATFPTPQPVIQSLSIYQTRVYIMDTEHNDIIRFARSSNSLGRGVSWLRAPAQLATARAAMVDGSVFVLQPGGVIEKYFNGRKSDFTLQAATPVVKDITRLWTSEESKNLYAVDPAGQRILVYDKEGVLIDQYRSSTWTALRDVIAIEREKIALVLNGSSIYSIPLLH